MGGTSVAAPLVARALAGLALEGKLGQGTGDVVELATIEALTDVLLDPPDRRAGRGVLSEALL
jgi:hypothetical protein